MKEPLMSGSGILWAYFELIYERNPRVFSNSVLGSVILPPSCIPERNPRTVIGAGLWSASLSLAFNPNDHASRYLVWFLPDSNPRPGFSALSGISGWSAGVWVSMGAGHVMAYAAIGLR